MFRRAVLAGLLVAGWTTYGCGITSSEPAGSTSTAPATTSWSPSLIPTATTPDGGSPTPTAAVELPTAPDAAFYTPGADLLASAPPGDLIDVMEIASFPRSRAWAILYASTGVDGDQVAVSGLIVTPATTAGDRPIPVLAWAHGTTGTADQVDCVPSQQGVYGLPHEFAAFADAGYAVVATDYEGLGTPGIHPYAVAASEGRSVLDAIRASRNVADLRVATTAVGIGHSQGGRAIIAAAELAEGYAPEIDLRGVIAAGAGASLEIIERFIFEQVEEGQATAASDALMVYQAWHEIYGLPLDGFLTAVGKDAALQSTLLCRYDYPDTLDLYTRPASDVPEWNQRITENTVGVTLTSVPIAFVDGEGDEPRENLSSMHERLCTTGDVVELFNVAGGHDGSYQWSVGAEGQAWLRERLDGAPPQGCNAAD
jgi:secretory lipase